MALYIAYMLVMTVLAGFLVYLRYLDLRAVQHDGAKYGHVAHRIVNAKAGKLLAIAMLGGAMLLLAHSKLWPY